MGLIKGIMPPIFSILCIFCTQGWLICSHHHVKPSVNLSRFEDEVASEVWGLIKDCPFGQVLSTYDDFK